MAVLDSVGCDRILRDIYLARQFYQSINEESSTKTIY